MTDVVSSHRLDSGIDVSIYQDHDSDCDILDLDRISLLDEDEESWLCAPKAKKENKDTDDVLSWLRKKAYSLDQKSRQSLIRKLDAIAKKNDAPLDTPGSAVELNRGHTFLVDLRNANKVDKRPSVDSNASEEDTFFDAVDEQERDMAAKLHETIKAQNQAQKLGTENFPRPQKMVVIQHPPDAQTEVSTPDFLASEASFAVSVGNHNIQSRKPMVNGHHSPVSLQTSNGSVRSKESSPSPRYETHVELNPELQDIHLLASMQEDDLRQCLERMQLQRRRRTESVNSDNAPNTLHSTNTHSGGGHSGGGHSGSHSGGVSKAALDQLAAALGKNTKDSSTSRQNAASQFRRDDKYKTYSKRSHNSGTSVVASTPTRRSTPSRTEALSISNRRVSEPKRAAVIPNPLKNMINSAIFTQSQSLQKSLPNLTSSKSGELSIAGEYGTSSEKGSYSNIPDTLSPTHSAHHVHTTPAKPSNTSRLRMPTPRSRLVTPGKTSIPGPSSNRFKSPAPMSRPRMQDNWKEDCF